MGSVQWLHDDLQGDLAQTRRACGELVGEKIGLESWGSHGQCDVVAVRPSWSNPRPTVYECKISRADLLADLRAEKWRKYLPYCERLMFAAPAGLADKREIPAEAGFIVRGPNGWSVLRAAPRRKAESEQYQALLFALLLKDHPAPWKRPPRAIRIRTLAEAKSLRFVAHNVGLRVAELARKAAEAERLEVEIGRVRELLLPVVPQAWAHWRTAVELAEWCAERLPPAGDVEFEIGQRCATGGS